MAIIPPHASAADNLERRLRHLPTTGGSQLGTPSAEEILSAVGTGAGPSRRAARLKAWAVSALQRANAPPATIAAMMDAADASSRSK